MDYFERQIIGWLFLLGGAFFLCKAAVHRREKGQMRELLGLPTDKVKRFRHFLQQRLESVVGFGFFLLGVGIHLYVVVRQGQKAALQNDPREALGDIGTYVAIAIVCMFLILALMHVVCSYFARRTFLDLLGYLMVRQRYELQDDPRLMVQIGEMLGVERTDGDTVETYTQRIESALRLDEIRADLLARGKLTDID